MEKEEKRADQENDTEEQSTEAKSLLKKKLQYYSSEIRRDVADDRGTCRMYYRSGEYTVFFCAEECDKLQERK